LYPFLKNPRLAHALLGILARIVVQRERHRESAPLICARFESDEELGLVSAGVEIPEVTGEYGIEEEKRVI